MTTEQTEEEYLAIVERIQQAMCIEPFRLDVTDVVRLIGAWRAQEREVERLRADRDELVRRVEEWQASTARQIEVTAPFRAEIERLRGWQAEAEIFMTNRVQAEADLVVQIERLLARERTARAMIEGSEKVIQRLREAINAYLESDSQANWDRLAELNSQ
jgi:seryl-tRNA synthetase